MEMFWNAVDYLTTNWQVLALVVVPFLTTLFAKLGRIGMVLTNIMSRLKDGTMTTQEKADTLDDIWSIFKGWLPNRSR
jgi:uncharacterized membrane-anchored protein